MRSTFGRFIFAPATPLAVQKAAQRLLGGPRLDTVRFSDGHLFDCFTSEKYWWFGDSYENDERGALEACLTPDTVLFDVGAHAGFWTVILASKCKRIHAFEPSPRNFARLNRNIQQNRIENVTLVPAAVSDRAATLHFIENGSMSHISAAGIPVEAITLDDYVARHEPPTAVKIDIEGCGAAALKGMTNTLSRFRPILFIELHNDDEVKGCCEILTEFGYISSPLGGTGRFPYRSQFVAS